MGNSELFNFEELDNEVNDNELDILGSLEEDLEEDENRVNRILMFQFNSTDEEFKYITEWDLVDNEKAIFVIANAEEDVLYKTLKLENESGNIIWQSNIIEVPENAMKVTGFTEGNFYMASQVLSADNPQLDSIDSKYKIYIDGEEENPLKVNFYVDRDIDRVLTVPVSEEGKQIVVNYSKDRSKYIINCMLDYLPISIDIRKCEAEPIGEYSIIIEKIGDVYVALDNIGSRIQGILFGENLYINFEGSVSDYIKKVKGKICTQYCMKSTEFDQFKILAIVDTDINDIELENVDILSRKDALDKISESGSVIMDLGKEALNILYYDEDNNLVNITSSGLGIKGDNGAVEEIKKVYNMLNIDKSNIVVTGLSVQPEIYCEIVGCSEDEFYNFDSLAKNLIN